MICKRNTSWYNSSEPLFPLKLNPSGSPLASSKLYTVVKYGSTISDSHVIFPECIYEPVCVYEAGQLDFSVSLVNGTYSNMCRIGNILYPTEERTTKTYKAYDYNSYDSLLKVEPGTPGSGSNAAPAYYQWNKSTKIKRVYGVSVALLVASRATDIDLVNRFVLRFEGSNGSGSGQSSFDLNTTDKNCYWYINPAGFVIEYSGVRYNVYEIGCDASSQPVNFLSSWTYCRISYGFGFSSIPSGCVFAILKGLVALIRPSALS